MNLTLREILTDSIGYWERRRIVYNVTLAIVSALTYLCSPQAQQRMHDIGASIGLLILAVIANLLYCAAYIPDIAMQYSGYSNLWKTWRIGLFLFGTFFASILAIIIVSAS